MIVSCLHRDRGIAGDRYYEAVILSNPRDFFTIGDTLTKQDWLMHSQKINGTIAFVKAFSEH